MSRRPSRPAHWYYARQKFLFGLAQLGVPVDEIDSFGDCVLSIVIHSECYFDPQPPDLNVFPLIHQFGTLTEANRTQKYKTITKYRIYGDVEEYAEMYGCGMLSAAVLAKSEAGVDKILARFPDSIHEQNDLGQTPLHLSASWPWGINRLLEAEALVDFSDKEGLSPIHYSSDFDCSSVTEKLLAVGSPLDQLGWLFKTQDLHLFNAVVMALADRRRELAELAKGVLSSPEYVVLVGSGVGLLDRTAYHVYKRLTDWPPEGTSLWEWLISKGADVSKKNTPAGASQIHFLALGVYEELEQLIVDEHSPSQALSQDWNLLPHVFESFTSALNCVFKEDYSRINDGCLCACSVHGCSSITVLLRELSRAPEKGFLAMCMTCFQNVRSTFLYWALETGLNQRQALDTVADDVIRSLLFADLGLTHTCCDLQLYYPSNSRVPSPQEISEIQDEEKELIAELESLCEEADHRWAQYQGSFVEFLESFRQEVRERPSKPISKKDIRKMEEIGVVLQRGTVVECDSSEESEGEVEDELDADEESEEEVEDELDADVYEDAAVEPDCVDSL
ncbi:hypothetical protein MMC30_001167 [Trapelia coarctata]|nr:hypothetical protein [Trapelia coarctata]